MNDTWQKLYRAIEKEYNGTASIMDTGEHLMASMQLREEEKAELKAYLRLFTVKHLLDLRLQTFDALVRQLPGVWSDLAETGHVFTWYENGYFLAAWPEQRFPKKTICIQDGPDIGARFASERIEGEADVQEVFPGVFADMNLDGKWFLCHEAKGQDDKYVVRHVGESVWTPVVYTAGGLWRIDDGVGEYGGQLAVMPAHSAKKTHLGTVQSAGITGAKLHLAQRCRKVVELRGIDQQVVQVY